jgi:alpha-tubulin suppressor-like RCC1 family protein
MVEGVGGIGTLSGVKSLTGDGYNYCALLTSRRVDCWGLGPHGELGNGQFYGFSPGGSNVPVQVEGVGGAGLLSGVVSLATNGGNDASYCAVLTSGGVDCWGGGDLGQLGDGQFYLYPGPTGSSVPVAVVGVGGTGVLSGVASITSDDEGYCALLKSHHVGCWGYGADGELGNGQSPGSSENYGSDFPVAVVGVGGTGVLSSVASLVSDVVNGYCAVLTSGQVNCWGYGLDLNLGDGGAANSNTPVVVMVDNGTLVDLRPLTGVARLTSDSDGFCALLTSGHVECWGLGSDGQIGDGRTSWPTQSGTSNAPIYPDSVKGVGGVGTLSGVKSLTSREGSDGASYASGFCALLTVGRVDCWGDGYFGELGNGHFYGEGVGSSVPEAVKGVGGVGTLSDVAEVTGDGTGYCAILVSSHVDCWGGGSGGQLGNGQVYFFPNSEPGGSDVPVAVQQ